MKKIKLGKLNIKNLILLGVYILCLSIIITDIFKIFCGIFNSISIGFTWFGVLTFILAYFITIILTDYFKDEMDK